jgi:hypothetical protein
MRRQRSPRAAIALLAVVVGLAVIGAPTTAAAQSAGGGEPPCWGCFGRSTGTSVVYGGSYHVRVKPPATPTAGTDGGGGGGGEVADCSGLMAPYQFPDQDLPVPCNDPRLAWSYQPIPGPCAGDALYYQEWWFFQSAVSTWFNGRVARNVCLSAQDFINAGVAPPPGLMALSVWRQMPFPEPELTVKPAVKGLVNLDSYFWVSGPASQARSVTVGPYTVAVKGQIVTYQWAWGDGSPKLSSDDPGSPWPAKSNIRHTYRDRGRYPVTVTTRWHGTFEVNGGAPQEVIGPDIFRTSTITYPVQALVVTLT